MWEKVAAIAIAMVVVKRLKREQERSFYYLLRASRVVSSSGIVAVNKWIV